MPTLTGDVATRNTTVGAPGRSDTSIGITKSSCIVVLLKRCHAIWCRRATMSGFQSSVASRMIATSVWLARSKAAISLAVVVHGRS